MKQAMEIAMQQVHANSMTHVRTDSLDQVSQKNPDYTKSLCASIHTVIPEWQAA